MDQIGGEPARDDYELIDFGAGRKLERFAGAIVDRPAPSAVGAARMTREVWQTADAIYTGGRVGEGRWSACAEIPQPWIMRTAVFALELRTTDSGQVGVFPEQADNWRWLAERLACREHPATVLNLFAYTGGTTLAAATVGASVTHVDAAATAVAWARRNAELSGLSERPIRWITEDAAKFAARELRRGKRYDCVVLDPPSYGHGPAGQAWKLERDLASLLERCVALLSYDDPALVVSCHTPEWPAERLSSAVTEALSARFSQSTLRIASGVMSLRVRDGRELPSGVFVRCWLK